MKRFLPYILILTIIVQIFAPFSVNRGVKNNLEVTSNKAEAVWSSIKSAALEEVNLNGNNLWKLSFLIKTESIADNTEIIFNLYKETKDQFISQKKGKIIDNNIVDVFTDVSLLDNTKYIFEWKISSLISTEDGVAKYGHYSATFTCNTQNFTDNNCVSVIENKYDNFSTNTSNFVWYFEYTNATTNTTSRSDDYIDEDDAKAQEKCQQSRQSMINEDGNKILRVGECKKETHFTTEAEKAAKNNSSMPACSLNPFWGSGTVMGCVAQVFYYVLFVPTSYVFALAGTFFDFTFNYSVQDKSYRSPFVVEGWGIVRDFCNMFFIFVLLYIAFGTILGLHSVKTKEMIINVVIIGLLINFSLFATQVIIDASNILARVFYNSDTIKITQGINAANGVTEATPKLKIGPNGEIPLSAAIVNKVNPQNLIINGTDAVKIQDKGQQTQNENDKENLSIGAFILIVLLATAVNIVGIITFLSVGLIFVARVIGLWLAMIVSPLVFFSYTVPSLQDMEMVGWKKWWPETLKLAFLAPIFIFFIYLIIAFLEKGLSLVKANDVNDGMTFVISIIVPFVFIMILLMKAKDIAKDMSGKMGQSITNGIAAAGAVALGGAGLGLAALGRGLIANPMKMVTQDQTTRDAALKKFRLYNPATYGKAISAGLGNVPHIIKTKADKLDANGTVVGKKTWGDHINEKIADKKEVDHSKQVLDAKAKELHLGDTYDNNLSFDEKKKVKEAVDKDLISKKLGYGKYDDIKNSANKNDVDTEYTNGYHNNTANIKHNAEHMEKSLGENVAVGEFVNALRKGSYDIRNISKLTTSSKGMAKAGVGLAAILATGVRTGLKKGVSIDYGTGQKDIWKDLGNIITDSLKDLKVDIKPSGGHGGGGHGDSHGGGHDAHGGGHH